MSIISTRYLSSFFFLVRMKSFRSVLWDESYFDKIINSVWRHGKYGLYWVDENQNCVHTIIVSVHPSKENFIIKRLVLLEVIRAHGLLVRHFAWFKKPIGSTDIITFLLAYAAVTLTHSSMPGSRNIALATFRELTFDRRLLAFAAGVRGGWGMI
jgi:hypothetical protein